MQGVSVSQGVQRNRNTYGAHKKLNETAAVDSKHAKDRAKNKKREAQNKKQRKQRQQQKKKDLVDMARSLSAHEVPRVIKSSASAKERKSS